MAATFPDVGEGVALTFSSGFFARVTSIDHDISVDAVDITHLGSTPPNLSTQVGGQEFMPGRLQDPGTLNVTMHFDPDTYPPLGQSAETVTLTFNLGGGSTEGNFSGSGFMQSFSVGPITPTGLMEANAVIKFTGLVTWTAES